MAGSLFWILDLTIRYSFTFVPFVCTIECIEYRILYIFEVEDGDDGDEKKRQKKLCMKDLTRVSKLGRSFIIPNSHGRSSFEQ